MSKGLKLVFCKDCNKKKFCKREVLPHYHIKYTCNKNHFWINEGFNIERINEIIKYAYLSELKKSFNRDDIFYSFLRKSK